MTILSTDNLSLSIKNKQFLTALLGNMIWINISEVWRYFVVVKPMLHKAFPGNDAIALVTPGIFISWMLWDTVLIIAATSFYWLYFAQQGRALRHAFVASLGFTISIFGLLWLGVANMGLAPINFLWAALPLAFAEQFIAAYIVLWAMRRK